MPVKGSIFQNPTTTLPESDPRIIRVPFDQQEMGARKSHLPGPSDISNKMTIRHVKSS